MRTLPVLLLASVLSLSGARGNGVSDDAEEVRGVTISCQTSGREWGTPGFAEELDELAELGVNWIAIHPYAWIRSDGTLRWQELDPENPPAWLSVPLAETKARGMSLLVKPHLGYWGSGFSWRGEIEFARPEERARFWEHYRRWILELSAVVAEAEAFVVGTELDRLVGDEDEWRGLIREVRERTDAHLTYASNWTDYERVPFWDDLDAIGVQAYFPLVSADDRSAPSEEQLIAGWTGVLDRLRGLHERYGKPVVFTELGYNLSLDAAREPWGHAVTRGAAREEARSLQERCLSVSLGVLERERAWLRGAFLWKWFVGEPDGPDFVVDEPGLRAVVSAAWSAPRSGSEELGD